MQIPSDIQLLYTTEINAALENFVSILTNLEFGEIVGFETWRYTCLL